MNILFYHGDETCPTMGGIQRTTALIADGLKRHYDYHCYNFYNYRKRYSDDIPRYKYEASECLPTNFSSEDVTELIERWRIDVIINQMGVDKNFYLKNAIRLSTYPCKLVYCHHNTPRRLFNLNLRQRYLSVLNAHSASERIKNLIKLLTHPMYSRLHNALTLIKNRNAYRRIYNDVEKFVLLSRQFVPEWQELTGIENASKLDAIPNMLSFKDFVSKEQILDKQKKLLLVARLQEFPKNITTALRIWQKLSLKPIFQDWEFDIVGDGDDRTYLESFVKRHGIQRVTFHGRQESQSFYQKASVFIMTSIREGWGMTLLEAMQNGCVPIAFDSFASVKDIIDDGVNGILVPAFDENIYADKLASLMSDKSMRIEMALNAVMKSKNFTEEKIIAQWDNILQEIKTS